MGDDHREDPIPHRIGTSQNSSTSSIHFHRSAQDLHGLILEGASARLEELPRLSEPHSELLDRPSSSVTLDSGSIIEATQLLEEDRERATDTRIDSEQSASHGDSQSDSELTCSTRNPCVRSSSAPAHYAHQILPVRQTNWTSDEDEATVESPRSTSPASSSPVNQEVEEEAAEAAETASAEMNSIVAPDLPQKTNNGEDLTDNGSRQDQQEPQATALAVSAALTAAKPPLSDKNAGLMGQSRQTNYVSEQLGSTNPRPTLAMAVHGVTNHLEQLQQANASKRQQSSQQQQQQPPPQRNVMDPEHLEEQERQMPRGPGQQQLEESQSTQATESAEVGQSQQSSEPSELVEQPLESFEDSPQPPEPPQVEPQIEQPTEPCQLEWLPQPPEPPQVEPQIEQPTEPCQLEGSPQPPELEELGELLPLQFRATQDNQDAEQGLRRARTLNHNRRRRTGVPDWLRNLFKLCAGKK